MNEAHPMWERVQAQFAAALLEPSLATPISVISERGEVAERFDIYRSSVVGGLVRALAVRFPAIERLVGQAFFAAMAGEFVCRHPPTSPALLDYGEGFVGFIATFEPATELPYLADVAQLENARVRAYHAADVEPLSPQSLASVPHENLAELTFEIHPSVTIVTSDHPVVTIWSMNVGEAEVGPIDRWIAEDALVTRPRACVETRRLAPGGALLLARLASGAELGAAVQTASADTPNFDLSVVLAEALSAGFFTAFRGDA
jgi:hypothetical protein